jgi:hypothetical protein
MSSSDWFYFGTGTNMIAINNLQLIQTQEGQELFLKLKTYLDTVIIRPNPNCGVAKYGIKQSDYFSGCIDNNGDFDPNCDRFNSLTVLLLDHVPPTEKILGIELINYFYYIRSFFTIYDKGAHAELHDFCGDITKQKNPIIVKGQPIGMLEFMCSYNCKLFFRYIVNQTFGYKKKIWISVRLDNPMLNSLIKYYMRIGFYNNPQIYTQPPSSNKEKIDDRDIMIGMWYDPVMSGKIGEIIQNTIELADFVAVQKKLKDHVYFQIIISPEYVKRFKALTLLDRECGFPLNHTLLKSHYNLDTVYISPFFGTNQLFLNYPLGGGYDPRFYPGDADFDFFGNLMENPSKRLLVNYHTNLDFQKEIKRKPNEPIQDIENHLYGSTPSKCKFHNPLNINFSFHTHPESVYRGLKINFPSAGDIILGLYSLQQFNFVFSKEGIWMYNLTNEIIKFYELLKQKVDKLPPLLKSSYNSLVLKNQGSIMMNNLVTIYHDFLMKLYIFLVDPTYANVDVIPLINRLFLNEAYVKTFLNLVVNEIENKEIFLEYMYLVFVKVIKTFSGTFSQQEDDYFQSRCGDFIKIGIDCNIQYLNLPDFFAKAVVDIAHLNKESEEVTRRNITFNGIMCSFNFIKYSDFITPEEVVLLKEVGMSLYLDIQIIDYKFKKWEESLGPGGFNVIVNCYSAHKDCPPKDEHYHIEPVPILDNGKTVDYNYNFHQIIPMSN